MRLSFRGRLRIGWRSMPRGSRVSRRANARKRVRAPFRMKGKDERNQRCHATGAPRRQDAVAEEDGNLHREAELQPWPQQGRGGGEEARARRSAIAWRQIRAGP